MAADDASLKIHIEPERPIDLLDLTAALGSLSRQYQEFALDNGYAKRPADARLVVSSVSRGSVDIVLYPEAYLAAGMLLPMLDRLQAMQNFADRLKWLFDLFTGRQESEVTVSDGSISAKDCADAINIAKPIARGGGKQNFVVIQGDVNVSLFEVSANDARRTIESASQWKARIELPDVVRRNGVSMVWSRIDRQQAKTEGTRSPDKGTITDIDPAPKSILFAEDVLHVKDEMIRDEDNPMQQVYFVDVEISRAGETITAYRIVGYHGKDEISGVAAGGTPLLPSA